jgi:hypothetical protein
MTISKKKALEKECLKRTDNFYLIEFGYSQKMVLPHADGIKLMECMQTAESYFSDYGETTEIRPLKLKDMITAKILSQKEYLTYKMNALLGVDTEITPDADLPF